MAKTIYFHGSLKALLPEPVTVNAESAIEAMHALVEMRPELKKFTSFDARPLVQIIGHETKSQLYAPTDADELHVVPAMIVSGSGRSGGFMKIVIGAVIIAATLLTYGAATAGIAAAWQAATASFVGGLALNFGTSLILGGLLSLISPVPRRDSGLSAAADPEASRYLGAQKNTVRIGTRIPIAYGTCKVYGHYLSFDSQATDVAT